MRRREAREGWRQATHEVRTCQRAAFMVRARPIRPGPVWHRPSPALMRP
ncbi:hypothetical protein RAA17_19910 [Komagataeibacter rhaeticus]|nr:hypothetical protein [Komagataeibacter rhaeticus]